MRPVISLQDFHRSLLQCFDSGIPQRIMVALSGGVDSMCLVYLLAQYKKAFYPSLEVAAITIDHGYRPNSAAEAAEVGKIVHKWGIFHTIEKLQYEKDVRSISNFEEAARFLRYKAFLRACMKYGTRSLLVAHNQDDQLETFLQRLQMNSTLFGLAGIRSRAPFPLGESPPDEERQARVYRPLLDYDKESIRRTCERNGVPWFEDPSNQDVRLTKRNLLRYLIKSYVPQFEKSRPELTCLSRTSLQESVDLVKHFVALYEGQKSDLDKFVKSRDFALDERACSITFTIPEFDFKTRDPIVWSRWLYETIYPISSAKHFRWSYAKLERKAVPRLTAFAYDHSKGLKMTYLNVLFNVENKDSILRFTLSKQSPSRDELKHCMVSGNSGKSQWILFDNIWWIKVSGPENEFTIRYVHQLDRQTLIDTFPVNEEDLRKVKNLEAIPIVSCKYTGNIISLPSFGFTVPGWKVECRLKNLT